jgi:hypothetical protein
METLIDYISRVERQPNKRTLEVAAEMMIADGIVDSVLGFQTMIVNIMYRRGFKLLFERDLFQWDEDYLIDSENGPSPKEMANRMRTVVRRTPKVVEKTFDFDLSWKDVATILRNTNLPLCNRGYSVVRHGVTHYSYIGLMNWQLLGTPFAFPIAISGLLAASGTYEMFAKLLEYHIAGHSFADTAQAIEFHFCNEEDFSRKYQYQYTLIQSDC